MSRLQNQVILITGASSGIGAALARLCAQRGARVALVARTDAALRALRDEITGAGGQALAIRADVTRPEDLDRMFRETIECWGRLDVLVNNAGFGLWGLFEELPMDVIRQNFETNLFAAIAACQLAIPHFRRQHAGLIVNVESVVALRAMPFSSAYSATKHALHAFSEALRVELAHDGIGVLSVCPGLISTAFHENRVQVGRSIETGPRWLCLPAEKCAARIIRAMERRRSQVIITTHARFLALVQRLSPRFVDWVLARGHQRALRHLKTGP